MFGHRCTRCGNRIRLRSRSCRHCNWQAARPAPAAAPRRSVRRRVGYGIGLVLGLVVILFVGQRMVEPTVIGEWYAEFAIQHLPAKFSSFAPAESATGAFLFCVRRVVKDKLEPESVATFPHATSAQTRTVGEGVYQVQGYVDEDRVTGERIRRSFACTVQYEQKRWVLHNLEVGSLAHGVE
jgi:hypothetical protein